MKRTAIYMRVSTDRQAQEGDSIPAQRDALKNYIASHSDMVFAGEYLDDGISGTKNDREEFQRLLSDVSAGKIDLILCTKMDRLHRSLRNFLAMQDILDANHCDWLAIWEPMYDSSTPQGRMIINMMVNLAQFEAEQTGQRIRQVNSYKVAQGEVVSGIVPAGYKIEGKHLVPGELAPSVKALFEYYSYGGSLRQTTLYANTIPGLPTTQKGVRLLLRNQKYIGVFRNNENFCTPIISRQLFDDVQRKLDMNVKASQKRVYIFSGLIKCGECGCCMTGGMKRGKPFYRCPKHFNQPTHACGNKRTIMETTVEKILLDNLREWIGNFVVSCKNTQSQIIDTHAQRDSILHKISRLKELYVNNLITLDEYREDKLKYEAMLDDLKCQPVSDPVDTSDLEKLLNTDIGSAYADFTQEEKRYFWRAVFKSITFNTDRSFTPVFLT